MTTVDMIVCYRVIALVLLKLCVAPPFWGFIGWINPVKPFPALDELLCQIRSL